MDQSAAANADPGLPRPEISVVLPCYRAAPLARRSAAALADFLSRSFDSWEVLVVDDGGGDFAAEDGFGASGPIRLIQFPQNRGKGAAVRAGMLAARGRVRLFTDVDLPFGPEIIAVAAEYILTRGFHAAVGDRTLPHSRYSLNVGWRRRLASSVFSQFVGTFLTGGFFDTQCGFKAFRADVAQSLFSLARIDRFASDVELLYLALLYRTDIKRIPVELRNNETSAVRLLPDSLRMLVDVARIRYFSGRGYYRSPELAEIVHNDFESVRGGRASPPAAPDATRSALSGAGWSP